MALVIVSRTVELNGRIRTEWVKNMNGLFETEKNLLYYFLCVYFLATLTFIISPFAAVISKQMVDESFASGQQSSQIKVFALVKYLCHMGECENRQNLIVDVPE